MSSISNFLPAPPDGFSTTLSASIASNALSIPLNSVSGLGTEGVGQLFKKDSSGNVVAGSIEYVHWTNVSGNTLTLSDTGDRGLTGSSSGAQAYSTGDYFEVWVTGQYYYKKQRDGFLAQHNQDGTHADVDLANSTDFLVEHNAAGTHKSALVTTLKASASDVAAGTNDLEIVTPLALAPLLSSFIQRQGIINGGMEVSQENGASTVALVNNTAKYACDLISVTPSGTAVSAGNQAQISNSTIGTSGYALKLAGVTITGAGTIKKRYRVEAADAVKYKNKAASFSMLELQDTGGSLNYTIQINKANSADDFSAVTQIAISGNLAVLTGAGTLIKLENVAMGDCSKGIEICVTIPCGAITTKNFETTEWQMNVGAVALPFVCGNRAEEMAKVMRYFEQSYPYGIPKQTSAAQGWANGATPSASFGTIGSDQYYSPVFYRVVKRAVVLPTICPYTTPTNTGRVSNNGGTDLGALTGSVVSYSDSSFVAYNHSGAGVTATFNVIIYHWFCDARFTA